MASVNVGPRVVDDNARKYPVSEERRITTRDWLASLPQVEAVGGRCDGCGHAEGPFYRVPDEAHMERPSAYCDLCAATRRAWDHGEAEMVGTVIAAALKVLHRIGDTASAGVLADGARLGGEMFQSEWERS